MGEFVNKKERAGQTEFNFSFQNQSLTKEQKVERKIYKRIAKNNYKRRVKIEDNKELISALVDECGPDEILHLVTDSLDSPNIINAYVDRIEEIYISTWSITPAGIACLENLASNGCLPALGDSENVNPPPDAGERNEHSAIPGTKPAFRYALLVLDRTHSYKWIFSSGAYKCLQGKIDIRITAIHSKIIAMRLSGGECLNFVGSPNLSNNPRWENIIISKDPADFTFYRDFLLSITAEKLK